MTGRRLALVGAVLLAAACVEQLTAPSHCPEFCPSGKIEIKDTLLADTIISRDSAFRGYVLPHQSAVMLAADLPGVVDGRAIFRINGVGSRFRISTTDTTTGPILGADSARLRIEITRRDTAATNLRLQFYRLPKTIDSTTGFAALAGAFTDSLVRTVNIDTLLARPGRKDPVTGDSVVVDSINNRLVLSLRLDSAAAHYIGTDSGTVAYGIRVAADSLASIAIGKSTSTLAIGPLLQWYLRVDSIGTPVARTPISLGAPFASFVFDPPPAPLDSNFAGSRFPYSTLAVGGVPSARSVLRVKFPRFIRDSSRVIRGTLLLVPAVPARGAPTDSFTIEAHAVLADFGAKSPILIDATRIDTTVIRIGASDTVKIEVTNLLQFWAADSTRPTTLVLRARDEAQSFAEIRFHPSVATVFRPALEITFVRQFPFGRP